MVKFFFYLYKKFRFLVDSLIGLNDKELIEVLKKSTLQKIKLSYSINLPYSKGRTVRGLSFTNEIKDPYSKIVADLLIGNSIDSITENLFSMCKEFKNYSVYEFIDNFNEGKFKSIPLWAIVNPWESISLKESRISYLNSFYVNRSEHNLVFTNSSNSFIESVIYSKESARSQVTQFDKLLKIILNNGYIENSNDLPTAVILIKNNKWCWIMSHSGNHRAHILKELGHSNLRCKIVGIVEYNDLSNCKNVLNNNYSLTQSKLFFDRVFEGKNPIRGPI